MAEKETHFICTRMNQWVSLGGTTETDNEEEEEVFTVYLPAYNNRPDLIW